jgi:hypothetical protein
VGGALFGIGGAILAAPTVAAGRDLYRYGFQRLGGRTPAEALVVVTRPPAPAPVEPEESSVPADPAPPSPA